MQVLDELKPSSIAVTGIPFDEYSSFLRGSALAPPQIRKAFHSPSANTFAENGLDIREQTSLTDVGDMVLSSYGDIETRMTAILNKANKVISFGGDHSITYPVIKAFAKKYDRLTILQLDAHTDLYEEFEGNRFSHACPFARILEENLAVRLVQVGIRTLTDHQKQQARRFGVEIHEFKNGIPGFPMAFDGPLYLSLDMDVLDPAFAPGISHYEPGGLSVRDVIRIIQGLPPVLVGADIVELNPTRDIQDMTAMVAAKFFREIAAKMLER